MTCDIENASSDISVSILNDTINPSKEKESFSLSTSAALPTNYIRDLFNRVEKFIEEKLQVPVNDNLKTVRRLF